MKPDWCSAGLWPIDPKRACPICGALPDTKCRGNTQKEDK